MASLDYVAFTPDGFAYALCCADQPKPAISEFFRECAGAEIRLMPLEEAVSAHRRWIDELNRRQSARQADPPNT